MKTHHSGNLENGYRCHWYSAAASIRFGIYRLVSRVHKNREYIEPNAAVGKARHKQTTADILNPFGWSVVATQGLCEALRSSNILLNSN